MTMTFGRLSGVSVLKTWRQSANSIEITGRLTEASLQQVQAARQQLEGYVDSPDESAAPLIITEDSTADGFYHVDGVDIDAGPGWAALFRMDFSLQLSRLRGYKVPLAESVRIGGDLTNDHGLVGAPTWWVPDTFLYVDAGGADSPDASNGAPRAAEDGSTVIRFDADETQDIRWQLPLSDWYDASATVKADYGDGTWRAVVGRQFPVGATEARISNGLVRVQPIHEASEGRLKVSLFHSGAWNTKTVRVTTNQAGSSSTGPVLSWQSVTVLHNSPVAASIRLVGGYKSGDWYNNAPLVVDVSVVRGKYLASVRCVVEDNDGTMTPGMEVVNPVEDADHDAADGYIYAAADDASGHRYILAINRAEQVAVASRGWITGTAPLNEAVFGVGLTPDHDVTDTARDRLVQEWVSKSAEQLRVVAR